MNGSISAMKTNNIRAVAFDADDTLWALQNQFLDVERESIVSFWLRSVIAKKSPQAFLRRRCPIWQTSDMAARLLLSRS